MKIALSLTKSCLSIIIILGLLKVTDSMDEVAYFTQSVVMKAGVLNVNPTEDKSDLKFDYAFTIKDLKGNQVSFEQFKGKVVFLNLWATWCGPCKAEMPGIQKLFSKLDNDSIKFVMLSLDKDEALSKVETYVKKNNYTFPIYMPSGFLADQLQVPSIPTTFVISKKGKVVLKEVGTRNYDTKKMIEFLKKQAAN